MKCYLWVLLLLYSCSPNSSIDFQHEGEAHCRVLVNDLGKIENREQLLRAEPQLKKHFEALVDLMIAARRFQQSHLEDVPHDGAPEENTMEVALEEELRRIYAIEGGREVIERAQHEALVRLDGDERAFTKKNEKLKINRK
jgi:hypothetical protein